MCRSRSAPASSPSLLAVVFGIWYARERTLSIHSIVTTPREAFYWLAVLVTFALGTAAGDWTLELTGWPPGKSVLLPPALILAVVIGVAARRQRRCCRSGSPTSSPARSAPTSATGSPCRRPTAASASAPR